MRRFILAKKETQAIFNISFPFLIDLFLQQFLFPVSLTKVKQFKIGMIPFY